MIIEFLICTIDEGIGRIESLLMPPMSNVRYLISWQHSKDLALGDISVKTEGGQINYALPILLESWKRRGDVQIIELEGKGLSRNRNYALSHATGDLLVIADDDCRYSPDCIPVICKAFESHPDAAVIQLQGYTLDGKPQRKYSSEPYEYKSRPRFSYVISWELVLRNQSHLPRFDERFGLGTELCCGEEELFVHQASVSGFKIYYEPYQLVRTPEDTTGTHFADSSSVQRAKGGVLTLMYGPLGAILRCLKFALCYPRVGWIRKCNFFIEMLKGIRYVLTHHSVS